MAYKAVKISKGRGGWGGPLVIKPEPGKDLIYCVTGGGIHPVAQRIADLTGGKVFDGFRSSAPEKQIACVVIDCGGTARIGVYPMKKILTIDVKASYRVWRRARRSLIVLCHSSSEAREVVGARFTAPAIHRQDPSAMRTMNRGRGEPGPYHTAHDGGSCEP